MSKAPRYTGRSETTSALTFLLAFQQSCPKTLGDRDYIGTLGEMLRTAIKCKMPFTRADLVHEKTLAVSTCVGVFRLVDDWAYTLACVHGSTYARMFEAAKGFEPWKAPLCLAHDSTQPVILQKNRVAPGMAVLLQPGKIEAADGDQNTLQWRRVEAVDYEVWYCTSYKTDEIRLGRYKDSGAWSGGASGSPVRRVKFSRAEWNKLVAAQAEKAQEPAHV